MNKQILTLSAGGYLVFLGITNASAQNLAATATLDQSGQTVWNYTLTNLEPAGSSNWLTDFYLPLNAPITDVQTSNGWQIDTDNTSYIQWYNTETFPYPNDVAPGLSASGFSFTSVATGSIVQYTLGSWDHTMDAVGSYAADNILTPDASPAAVPESSASVSLGILLALGGVGVMARRRMGRTG